VLPRWAAETWLVIMHTYAFQLRDVSTYVGIESPEKAVRGKTTLFVGLTMKITASLTAACDHIFITTAGEVDNDELSWPSLGARR